MLLFLFYQLLLGAFLNLNIVEWFFVLFAGFQVISSEVLNTIIEKLCDFCETKKNIKIKIIKDMSAGYVAFACIFGIIIDGIVFFSKLKLIL